MPLGRTEKQLLLPISLTLLSLTQLVTFLHVVNLLLGISESFFGVKSRTRIPRLLLPAGSSIKWKLPPRTILAILTPPQHASLVTRDRLKGSLPTRKLGTGAPLIEALLLPIKAHGLYLA